MKINIKKLLKSKNVFITVSEDLGWSNKDLFSEKVREADETIKKYGLPKIKK